MNIKTDSSKWVHLHIHDDYSLLDGFSKVEEYAEEAKKRNYEYLAITNHGIIGQIPRQYKICKKLGLTPIYGCEVYFNDYRDLSHGSKKSDDIEYPPEFANADEFRKAYRRNNHLVLLAKNEQGFKNLIKITSDAWINGFYHRPRSSLKIIKEYSEGLICGSACLAGPLNRLFLAGKFYEATLLAKEFKEVFGDNFYIEIMLLDMPEQMQVTKHLVELATKLNIKLVLTNDTHYLNKDDSYFQDIMLLMQRNGTVYDLLNEDSFQIHTKDLWFKTVDELDEAYLKLVDKYPELCESLTPELYKQAKENVMYYAQQCKVDIDTTPKFPDYYPSSKREKTVYYKQYKGDSGAYLRALAYSGLRKRGIDTPEYRDRIEKELDVINRKNYNDYFLIVKDIIQYALKSDIPVGPGRGSAAGALLCYCLEITDVDPLERQLLFERFLNEGRADFPDIDIDFAPFGRDSIKEYIHKRYERDHIARRMADELNYTDDQIEEAFEKKSVPFQLNENRTCSIGTYGTFQTKSTVLDVCRVFAVPLEIARFVSKALPAEIDDMSYDEIMQNQEYKSLLDRLKDYKHTFQHSEDSKEISILEAVFAIRGRQKNLGKHAAGVIISKVDLRESLPLVTREKNIISSWIEGLKGNELSQFGFVKWDILGLANLVYINEALDLINTRHNKNINVKQIDSNLNDPNVYKPLRKGQSALIFQFESNLMRRLLRDSDCDSFECLTAVTALGRPGPLQSGMTEEFCKRKLGKSEYKLEPILEPILGETHGVFCYQEQVMNVAHIVGGLSLVETDNLRKILIKFKKDAADEIKQKFDEYKNKFIEGGQRYFSKEQCVDMFDGFSKWASYGFNKSHAVCYTVVSYRCAWLKTYYPIEYICAVLKNVSKGESGTGKGKKNRYQEYVQEALRLQIKILPPSINYSEVNFSIQADDEIRIGLSNIKGIGEEDAKNLVANAPYVDFTDFLKRGKYTKRNMIPLIFVGAFDEFGDRLELYIRYFIHRKEKWHKERGRLRKKPSYLNDLCADIIKKLGVKYGKDGKVENLDNKELKSLDLTDFYKEIRLTDEDKDRLFFEEFQFALIHPVHNKKIADLRGDYLDKSTLDVKNIAELNTDKTGTAIGLLTSIYKAPTKRNPDKFFYSLTFEDGYSDEDKIKIILFQEDFEQYEDLLAENEVYLFTCKGVPNYSTFNAVGWKPFVKFNRENLRKMHRLNYVLDYVISKSRTKNHLLNVNNAGYLEDYEETNIYGFIKSIREVKNKYSLILSDLFDEIEIVLWKGNPMSLRKDKSIEIIADLEVDNLVRMKVKKLPDYNNRKNCEYISHKKYSYKKI